MKTESQFIRENIQELTDAKGRELVAILKGYRSYDVAMMLLADLYLKALARIEPNVPVDGRKCVVRIGSIHANVVYEIDEDGIIILDVQPIDGNGIASLIEPSRWKQLVSDVESIAHKEGYL